PPFWFPGLSNTANINGMNNVSSSSSGSSDTKSMQTVQQSGNKALNVYVNVSNDSVVWGSERTVNISVLDRASSQPISNAIVTGNIASFPTGKTGLSKSFVLITNNAGKASYSWLMPYTNTQDSTYKISISTSAPGYNTTTASLISAATDINNFTQNKNDSNNLQPYNENSQVSTLH